jgi:cytochrome c5
MDTGLLHTHNLLVILYALLLLAKLVLIIGKRQDQLATLNRKTKVVHIVLAAGFTLTGLVMAFRAPLGAGTVYLVKYAILLAVIGLGVVGVKRMNPVLTGLALLLIVYVYGASKTHSLALQPERARLATIAATAAVDHPGDTLALGRALYNDACVRCHGPQGDSGYLKSKNLQREGIGQDYITTVLLAGQNTMPKYDYLTNDQRTALARYVLSLGRVQK